MSRKLEIPQWGLTIIEDKEPVWLIVVHNILHSDEDLQINTTMSIVMAACMEDVKQIVRESVPEFDDVHIYNLISLMDQARIFDDLDKTLEDIDIE
jgi:hypothetical protein